MRRTFVFTPRKAMVIMSSAADMAIDIQYGSDEYAQVYDMIYAQKRDYRAWGTHIHALIRRRLTNLSSDRPALLEVGCGTGLQLQYLAEHYEAEGFDPNGALLRCAQQRLPNLRLNSGDETIKLDMGKQYDAITMPWGTLNFQRSVENLRETVARMASHLRSGGVLVVEPWHLPFRVSPNPQADSYANSGTGTVIARVSVQLGEEPLVSNFTNYLVGRMQADDTGRRTNWVQEFQTVARLRVHTPAEYCEAMTQAGLQRVWHDVSGPDGRSLFVATK
jgi:ubiquinone/menaquinone biosynthesis C-methylase UbiE